MDLEFNAKNLRINTKQAIIRKEEEAKRQKEIEEEKRRLEIEAENNRATEIINKTISKAKEASDDGKSAVLVMKLNLYGKNADIIDRNVSKCERQHLTTTAAKVYDYFEKAGFSIELAYDHDGVGREDWFNMILRWG